MNTKKKSIFYVVAGLLVVMFIFFEINKYQHDTSNYKTVEITSNNEGIENGIHVNTGLIEAEGLSLVIAHCTGMSFRKTHHSKQALKRRVARNHSLDATNSKPMGSR